MNNYFAMNRSLLDANEAALNKKEIDDMKEAKKQERIEAQKERRKQEMIKDADWGLLRGAVTELSTKDVQYDDNIVAIYKEINKSPSQELYADLGKQVAEMLLNHIAKTVDTEAMDWEDEE